MFNIFILVLFWRITGLVDSFTRSSFNGLLDRRLLIFLKLYVLNLFNYFTVLLNISVNYL